jgi:S-DNA-T family DNA segregation ATPase FtsK/SpoIIIE
VPESDRLQPGNLWRRLALPKAIAKASVSMIQRRLRIGYNRAARMVEQMEREGLVTPGDGMRPREVRSRTAN